MLHFRYVTKNWEKIFSVLDKCSWIVCGKFFLSLREFLSSAVNVLTHSSKMLDITKAKIFPHNFSQSYKRIWWNFQQFYRHFNMLNAEGCSETGLFKHLSLSQSLISAIHNLRGSYLFFKMFKMLYIFRICSQKLIKFFCFKQNCNWIGCWKWPITKRILATRTVLRFQISLKRTFSKSIFAKVMKQYDVSLLVPFSDCLTR